MKHFYKLGNVNTTPLMASIMRQPELWSEDTYLRKFPQGPFGETESIMLRFPRQVMLKDEDVELYKQNLLPGYDQHESIFYNGWSALPEAREIVFSLMATVKGIRLGRVMINKVKPGGRIYRHADTPEHVSRWRRHHVVLSGLPGALLMCDDEQINMLTGDVFWFNNALEHEVVNNSGDDRISMVIDIQTEDVIV